MYSSVPVPKTHLTAALFDSNYANSESLVRNPGSPPTKVDGYRFLSDTRTSPPPCENGRISLVTDDTVTTEPASFLSQEITVLSKQIQSPTAGDPTVRGDNSAPAFVDRFLTDHEVAVLVGLKRTTLQVERYVGGSRIPFVRVGSAIRYRMSDVQAFIASLPAVFFRLNPRPGCQKWRRYEALYDGGIHLRALLAPELIEELRRQLAASRPTKSHRRSVERFVGCSIAFRFCGSLGCPIDCAIARLAA